MQPETGLSLCFTSIFTRSWNRKRFQSSAICSSSVLDYIAAHSPAGARRVQARIQAIIDLLLLYPAMGTRTDHPAIRRMTALPYPYAIFYEATEAEMIIHAIRHSARDPSSMPGAPHIGDLPNT